jgi:hypothetical protein
VKQFFKNAWVKLVVIFSVVDWKDVAVRAAKTLVQAFIASVGFSIASGNALDTVLTSALAAAVSALWNGVLSPVWKALGQKADEVIVAPDPKPVSVTDGGMVHVEVSAVEGATLPEINAALEAAKLDAAKELNKA